MVLVLAALVVIFLVLSYLAYLEQVKLSRQATRHEAVGRRLSRFSLEPLLGVEEPLCSEELAGQVVLINLWGPWCPPCCEELPHLMAVVQKFAERRDFRFVSVCCDFASPDNLAVLREDALLVLRRCGKEGLPVYADPQGQARQVLRQVGVLDYFPTTLLLDRRGTIRAVWPGYNPQVIHQVEATIEQLLNEPSN